jgi:hypothetical protein
MEGFKSKEEAVNNAVLEVVANGGREIIVHQDQPSGEPYREHDLENDRACWCYPDVFIVGGS